MENIEKIMQGEVLYICVDPAKGEVTLLEYFDHITKMNDAINTLDAIEASIIKWKAIVAGTYQEVKRRGVNRFLCPLCVLFTNKQEDVAECHRCPIGILTDDAACNGTAFYHTSLWNKLDKPSRWDNHMLSYLYDIRRREVAKIGYLRQGRF